MKSNVHIVISGILVLLIGIAVLGFVAYKWQEREAFLRGETDTQPRWSDIRESIPDSQPAPAEEPEERYGWVTVPVPVTTPLYAVVFSSSEAVHAFGAYGLVLQSITGGETFSVLATTINESLRGAVFAGESIGIAVGDGTRHDPETQEPLPGGTVLVTSDGGEKWGLAGGAVARAVPLRAVTVRGTNFTAVGEQGTVIESINAGETWQQRATLATEEQPVVLNDISFATDEVGMAVGFATYRTEDGGLTWREVDISYEDAPEENTFQAVYMADEAVAYVAGDAGDLLVTEDGGSTWKQVKVSDEPLHDILFIDDLHGYIAGAGGLFETNDGGATWVSVPGTKQYVLYDLSHNGEDIIIAVGTEGTVLRGVIMPEIE